MTNLDRIKKLEAWQASHTIEHTSKPLHLHETPPPDPPPDPGVRPFPAPVTPTTVQAPASGDLHVFLAAQANGSYVKCPPGSVYDWPKGVLLQGRQHLVVDMTDCKVLLKTPGGNSDPAARASAFMLKDSHDIRLLLPEVIGNNPDTSNIFVPGNEGQHVLSLNGWASTGPSWNVEVTGGKASHIYGDFAYLEGRNGLDFAPSHHVWIHGTNAEYIGRNQVSSINVNDLLVEGNDFTRSGGAVWDIEPNYAAEQVKRNTLRGNRVGTFGHMSQFDAWFTVCAFVYATPVEDIVIDDNDVAGNPSAGKTQTPRALNSKIIGKYTTGAGVRQKRVTFTNNRTALPVAGPAGADGVLYFKDIDGVTVQGNVQPLTSGQLAYFVNCTGIVQ